jgi:predicted O-linked N-acetylglucosamine transferase (SPINDLY family)
LTTVLDDDVFRRALTALQAGRIADAEQALQAVLRTQPRHLGALNLLGVVYSQLGRFADAEAYLHRALAENADSDATLYNYALVLKGLNRPAEALERLTQALALNGTVAETWNNRGALLNDLQRFEDATGDFSKAIEINPRYAEAHANKGKSLTNLRRFEEAAAAFDHALSLKPDLAEALIGRANLFYIAGRYGEAASTYEQALACRPDVAQAWFGYGSSLFECERYDEALAAFDKALAREPNWARTHANRGATLLRLKRRALALAACDEAIALAPDLVYAYSNRATALFHLQRYQEAIESCEKAIALDPGNADAWLVRGKVLAKTGHSSEALGALDKALNANPNLADAWHCRAGVLLDTNHGPEALAALDRALAIKPDFADAISDRVFVLDFLNDNFEDQQKARNLWWQNIGQAIAQRSQPRFVASRDPNRRIRIGYVSADFRSHSAARCFRPMLFNHDKGGFEITCYSCSDIEDELTRDFRRAADRWRDVMELSDDALCRQIEADEIDILVDLSGHTAGHRFGVFARKAAPVQVSAGATGTGLPVIDYLFSDPVACPATVRHLFAEKIVDLPSIMTIEPVPEGLRPADPPLLGKGYATFGVFNRVSKITDQAVALWSRILHAVPQSRLLMKDTAFEDAAAKSRQRERFEECGIDPDRIAFLGRTARPDHLAAFGEVDISLDPFPQNGGISALESMQMGVPVIALLGNSISSRAAGSILTSLAMNEWVAEDAEQYLAIAVKFAAMPHLLKALRYELPERILASALGDAIVYTRAIEEAYRAMWADYCPAPPEAAGASTAKLRGASPR